MPRACEADAYSSVKVHGLAHVSQIAKTKRCVASRTLVRKGSGTGNIHHAGEINHPEGETIARASISPLA